LLELPDIVQSTTLPNFNGYGAVDYNLYMGVAMRWLDGGPYFQPYQLAGPYSIQAGDVLYPPVALWLFVPFTVMPALLWWLIPLGTTAWVVISMRPSVVVWPLLSLCLVWPPTLVKVVTGNPVIWAVAAIALACLYKWPAVFVLLKPSLAPVALFGAKHRSWWVALGVLVLLSLPFTSLWPDWITSLANSRGGGLAYSILELPMLALPLVAWAGRTR